LIIIYLLITVSRLRLKKITNLLNKETSHRSYELKSLGWNQEDISRYEELWDYCQRWGLINLEREDRQFLKKAEKLIPKLQPKKQSLKKSIEEKSYFLWLNFYLKEIDAFDKSNLEKDKKSVWSTLIEEEIILLKEFKPVMGLPDTLKAKNLYKIRKKLIEKAFKNHKAKENKNLFNFDIVLNYLDNNKNKIKSWKSILENDSESGKFYPIIDNKLVDSFRKDVKKEIKDFMIKNYPSLKEIL
tara:strand:+ start:7795 stop:8523 length:729 start_codon:yes stop_codon:yes gene_type:complete